MLRQILHVVESMRSTESPQAENDIVELHYVRSIDSARRVVETVLLARESTQVETILGNVALQDIHRSAIAEDVRYTVRSSPAQIARMLTIHPLDEPQPSICWNRIQVHPQTLPSLALRNTWPQS